MGTKIKAYKYDYPNFVALQQLCEWEAFNQTAMKCLALCCLPLCFCKCCPGLMDRMSLKTVGEHDISFYKACCYFQNYKLYFFCLLNHEILSKT